MAKILSPILYVSSVDLQSGVVVDVGHGVATCAVVWNRELRDSVSCSPSDATPDKLAHMVEDLVKKTCGEGEVDVLRQHVVLTGACSFHT